MSTELGQMLVKAGKITPEQLEIALKRQQESHDLLGVVLVKLGFVDEESVFLPILATQLNVDFVNLKNLEIPKEIIAKIPPRFASYYKVIPVEESAGELTIATSHPLDIDIIDGIGLVVSSKIKTILASEKEILEEYKGLVEEDIRACFLFATKALKDTEFMPLAVEPTL